MCSIKYIVGVVSGTIHVFFNVYDNRKLQCPRANGPGMTVPW